MKERWQVFTIVFLIAALFVGGLIWLNYSLVPTLPGGENFLVPWVGAHTFLFDHVTPYTLDTAHRIQVEIYGQFARDGQYPYLLDIPFHLLVLYFPFVLIQNFNLARAVWMSLAEIAFVGVGFLSVHLAEWKGSRLLVSFFYLTLLFSFYSIYPLLGGSAGIFTALLLLLALLAFREGWDGLLGVLLIFGTWRFANGGLLFILLILWLIFNKRWSVFSIGLMALAFLLAVSFFLLPDWGLPWIRSVITNARVGQGFLLGDWLQTWQPEYGKAIIQILRWSFVVILFLEWRGARGQDFQRLLWVAGLTLASVPFLNFRVSPLFYTNFFLPLALVFKIAENRWEGRARLVITLVSLLLLAAWGLFFRLDVQPTLQVLTFVFPAFLVLALYWVRWWQIRPPRTWLDEAAKFQQ